MARTPAEVARSMVAAALAAVAPADLVRRALAAHRQRQRDSSSQATERWGAVLAVGKAAPGMARGVHDAWLAAGAPRLLLRTHTTPALADPAWEEHSGGHPVSDAASLAAGERALQWLGSLDAAAPLLVLISGGSSACVEALAAGITLVDLATTQRVLLGSGLPIHEFNAVRKHLSRWKGGGGLRACRCPVLALLLSDVPGDDPGTIGSGPFAADTTTYAGSAAAVAGLPLPAAVRERLAAGARGEWPETVKPGDVKLRRLETRLVGSAATAVEAVAREARRAGFAVTTGSLAGEAALAAADLVARGRALPGERAALILGGETTVTLGPGAGRGGRNQELALAAARALAGSGGSGETAGGAGGELAFSLASDGEDGPTEAAGGMVDDTTWAALAARGIDPAAALAAHDSNRALAALPGALLITGSTGTNVGDVAVYLRQRR